MSRTYRMAGHMPSQQPVEPNRSRRAFISYLPIGIIAGVFGTMFTAAFRFLRPVVGAANDKWIDVAQLNELTGNSPIAKRIMTENSAGWAITTEEHSVFVLPARSNQVLSAICP